MEAVLDACVEIGSDKTVLALSLMNEQAYRRRAARLIITATVAPTLSVYNVELALPSILDLSDELPDQMVRVVPPFDLSSLSLFLQKVLTCFGGESSQAASRISARVFCLKLLYRHRFSLGLSPPRANYYEANCFLNASFQFLSSLCEQGQYP